MPRRKTLVKSSRLLSQIDVEALRRAIRAGWPWIKHSDHPTYRDAHLTMAQSILLSYVTGIVAGAGVFLAGNPHPSRETVEALKAKLQPDIDVAEAKFRGVFKGKRHPYSFFNCRGPEDPRRETY